MPISTSQQISNYYDNHKDTDVTFTKQVIAATGLDPRETSLKLSGYQVPCVIYSSSMSGARIIANLTVEVSERLRQANNLVSIRFAFLRPEAPTPIFFFVPGKVTASEPYGDDKSPTSFLTVSYTTRPADDLIEVLGELLDMNAAASRRSEVRIVLTQENAERLGLLGRDTIVLIEEVPRKCIVRDLSFGGAKVLLVGLARFLVDKRALLKIRFASDRRPIEIPGKVIRFDEVQERQDIAAIAIQFDRDRVPMAYKLRIHQFLESRTR